MKKHKVFFISLGTLIKQLKREDDIEYRHLGLRLSSNIALGGIFYKIREHKENRHAHNLFVEENSFDKNRKVIIEYLIEEIAIPEYQLGLANSTIFNHLKNTIKFIDWCDANNLELLFSKPSAREVYQQYTLYLKNSIRDGSFQYSTAGARQTQARKLLRGIFNDKEGFITSGIPKIPSNINSSNVGCSEKSSELDYKYAFNFYNDLFHQIADFLLEGKEYPYSINLVNKTYWLLPFQSRLPWIIGTHNSTAVKAFDYELGELIDSKKMESLYSLNRKSINSAKSKLRIRIQKHNIDKITDVRLYLGTIGMKAYYMLFLMLTGINDSTASSLSWDGDYTIEKEYQKFRNIKYRAGNKPVEFQIQSRFIGAFQKFLTLRDFVLNGYSCEYLFFNHYGKSVSLTIEQLSGKYSSVINNYMKRQIDSSLPIINSRQSRVNKTHWVINKFGIKRAAQVAQTSVNVINKAYTGESENSSSLQLTEYFHKLNNLVLNKTNSDTNVSIGHCADPYNPKTDVDSISCNQNYGCLFCKQFRTHADEEDICKLYSALYVVDESRYVAKNEEHFQKVLGGVESRINSILNKIATINDVKINLLQKVKKRVYEDEILHPYWEHKLTTLVRMGVLK